MQILNRVFSWWKTQKILVKIITGLAILIFACCVCSIPLSIIAPDRTPTPQPAAQDNPTTPTIPETPIPGDTPAPTNTSVPADKPISTNTSVPELSFADITQHPDEKGWTSSQYSTYFDTIKGQYVTGWSGTILEIDESAGKPYLSLDMKPGEPKIDVYIYINEDDFLKVGLGQNVTFAGTIDRNWPEDNGFYALQIEDVTLLELGEISPTPTPGPTSTPTNTPAPTNTPIPKLFFTDIIQHPDEKGWTSTQYSTYLDTIKGEYVSGWSGTILEIDESVGKPYLSLDMKPGEPKIDVYIYINEDDVSKVGLEQNVTFAGTIDGNWPEDNGFYALQIEDVRLLELGEVPPTPTPGPTSTPTPDIGSDTMAEVMCQDFVEDNLKAPSTADFGGFLDDRDKAAFIEADKASELGIDTTNLRNSGIWVVVGQVDAENAFGAMIRSEYTCVMDYDKNSEMWYLLDISIK